MSSSRPLRPVRRQGVDPGVFAARAIGRSPEEHERLERMLAARRRRRDATDSGLPATAVAIAEQEGRLRQEEELRRLEELRQLEELRWGREQLRQQLQLRSAEDIVRQRQGGHGGLLLPPPWPPSPPWRHLPALDGSTAQRRAALLAPFGFERRRPARRRLCRGKGWHRKGWRDLGMMWINVKAGSEYTRGQDVRQDSTLKDFVRQVQSRSSYGPLFLFCFSLLACFADAWPSCMQSSIHPYLVPQCNGTRLYRLGCKGYV